MTIALIAVLFCAENLTRYDAPVFAALTEGLRLLLRTLPPDTSVVDAVREAAYAVVTLLMVIAVGSFIGGGRGRKAVEGMTKSAALGTAVDDNKKSPQVRSSLRRGLGSRTSSCDGQCLAEDFQKHSVLDKQTPETKILAKLVREGRTAQIPKYLDSMYRSAVRGGTGAGEKVLVTTHLLSVLRACVAHRFFEAAIQAYDHVEGRIVDDCPSIWSILLFCAIESDSYVRCREFVDKLRKYGKATGKDFVNMTRFYARTNDLENFERFLDELKEAGFQADPQSRCAALLMCASMRAFDHADVLLRSRICGASLDTLTCNMLMSGFVQAKEPERCFAIWSLMRQAELAPSEQTFGILLNACCLRGQFEHAKGIFEDLQTSGLSLNVVHYTSLMKNLLRAGRHHDALGVLDNMQAAGGVAPDIVAYSTLIKAFADLGSVNDAVDVLQRMITQGIYPTVVIFNTVLGACAAAPQPPQLIMNTLEKLVNLGLKPSTATLSILVRALAKAKALHMALEVLDNSRSRYSLWAEPRVYTQLAQAALKMGNRHLVIGACSSMWRTARDAGLSVEAGTNERMLRLCQSCGEGSAALAIMHETTRLPLPVAEELCMRDGVELDEAWCD